MSPEFVNSTVFYVVLLISLVVHEAAHALTALWGGDRTAYLGGQVTLNPIPHIQREPFGTVLLPIGMLIFSQGTMCMGYAHTPIDPVWAYHHPRKAAWMSAAGPVSNLLLAIVALIVLKVLIANGMVRIASGGLFDVFRPADGATDGALHAVCLISTVFLFLNLLLFVLNLIPFPPLDGAGVLGGFFPRSAGRVIETLRSQPMFLLAGMVVIFVYVPGVIFAVFNWVIETFLR